MDPTVEVGPCRRMPRKELVVAAGEGFLVGRRCFRRRPLPEGGLYRRPVLTRLEIHSAVTRDLASVEAPGICERLAPHMYSSGTSLQGALASAAALEYSSASDPVMREPSGH